MALRPIALTPDRFVAHCQATGFSVAEASAFFHELAALASPYQFEPQRLRRTAWLRALAHWHRRLRDRVRHIRSVEDWRAYQKAWMRPHEASALGFQGPHAQGAQFVESGDAVHFVARHWPLLSLGEPEAAFEGRRQGVWPTFEPATSWNALNAQVTHPRLLGRLLKALNLVPDPTRPDPSWTQALRETGLRSVRVHWAESHHGRQTDLVQVLLEAQAMVAGPVKWAGPVLGLAGATGLELVAGHGGERSGQVRLDPYATGQTLMVDDWGVMAHEWLHTLDATLARDCQQPTRWMTLGMAEDEPSLPSDPRVEAAGSAWWDQVACVQFLPLPAEVRTAVQRDLNRWPERLRQTLGGAPGVEEHLAEESLQMDRGQWHEAEAQARWEAWMEAALPEADADLRWRTAQMFSAEMALAVHTDDFDGPVWANFLRERTHDRGLGRWAARASQQRYLSSPIELMARSFEAAFGPHEGGPNPVWQVTRAEAGMRWPLPAERAHQREGWLRCFQALTPWWQLRQGTRSPLDRLGRG